MNNGKYDIKDDEFRVLRTQSSKHEIMQPKISSKRYVKLIGWIVTAILILGSLLIISREKQSDDKAPTIDKNLLSDTTSIVPLGYNADTSRAYTQHLRDTINDIPLDIFIPHNSKPELRFGPIDLNDTDIVLVVSAADIRADNGYPVGAYVIDGNPICGGIAKDGYCAIINDELRLGMAENTQLYEEATKTNGYFFRQFPLVYNRMQIENEARGKSIRKALCVRGNEIFVAITASRESYHDFAEALVDLKVDNAISLVGSTAFASYRNLTGEMNVVYSHLFKSKYENFILWVKK